MSVYDYPVPTTPWLNTAPGLFIDDYTSTASSTVSSLSRTLIYDYEQNPDSGNNVVALAAKAGYSTWWISNQGKLGEHDTRISVIASDAEHATFLKKGSFASRKTDDKLLLQETERALADTSSPKIIFLHMMGSIQIRVTALTPSRIITWSSIPEKLPVTSPASVNWITFLASLMVSFAGTHVISPCFTFLALGCRSATVPILFIIMVMCREATVCH